MPISLRRTKSALFALRGITREHRELQRNRVTKDCPLLPVLRPHVDGECDKCGKPLSGRRRRWCSDKCAGWLAHEFAKNHEWRYARRAAKRRDRYRCVKCGSQSKLEVNHISPLFGSGYTPSCLHHLEGLQTLCHGCHVKETNLQRRTRAKVQNKPLGGVLN